MYKGDVDMTSEDMLVKLDEMIGHAVRQAISDPIHASDWVEIRVSLQDAATRIKQLREK